MRARSCCQRPDFLLKCLSGCGTPREGGDGGREMVVAGLVEGERGCCKSRSCSPALELPPPHHQLHRLFPIPCVSRPLANDTFCFERM